MTKAEIQQVKLRFGIIGNNAGLMRAIDIAIQVAPTDLSVLITGESGVGKESFPQIIHQYSRRKHGQYIAVNCGAIPEGTTSYTFLMNQPTGSVTLRQLSKEGNVLSSTPLDTPYERVEVNKEAATLQIEGSGEFFEIIGK